VKSGAKCGFVGEAQIARLRVHVRRHDAKASDMNRAGRLSTHTDQSSRPTAGETEISAMPSACATWSAVTLSGIRAGDPAVLRDLGVDGAEGPRADRTHHRRHGGGLHGTARSKRNVPAVRRSRLIDRRAPMSGPRRRREHT
jgi:hypothetical protein